MRQPLGRPRGESTHVRCSFGAQRRTLLAAAEREDALRDALVAGAAGMNTVGEIRAGDDLGRGDAVADDLAVAQVPTGGGGVISP